MKFETRDSVEGVELRSTDDGSRTLVGYAAVWNSESGNLGGFTERVMPGAFTKTMGEADVRAVMNHDASLVLGRSRSGTLRLEEDDHGLRYEVDLPDTATARDVATLIERGDISGSSFKFRVVKQEWDREDRDLPLRSLTEVSLADVGPVTYPAYDATEGQLALRSLIEGDDKSSEKPDDEAGEEEPSGDAHSPRSHMGRFVG